MTQTPSACVRAMLIAATLFFGLLSAGPSYAQPAASGDRFQGFLSVVWGDPHPGVLAGGRTRFTLAYPDGTRVPLDIRPELQNEAVRHSGKRVTVRGRASTESGATRIRVDSIEPAESGPRTEAVTGTRKVLFILLRFQGDTQKPHPPDFFLDLTNPLIPPAGIPATINGFFNKVSYGKFKWQADVVGPGGLNPTQWFVLPHSRTFYVNCGATAACANLDQIGDDALALVAAEGVDVNDYDNLNFVVNNDLDCCAWGGSYSNGMNSWGATWEPPWGQETSTYVHEMGHSLGLPHSGWRYYAYDGHHDEMSRGHPASSVQCGTYNSKLFGGPNTPITCNEPGAGYIMAHQDFLGWIPLARKVNHSTKSIKVYDIEANSLPLGTDYKLVKVCVTGKSCSPAHGAARYITVEVKTRARDFDSGVPSQGVVIHDVMMNRPAIGGACYFNNQSGWALPSDAKPGDFNSNTCSPQDPLPPGAALLDMAYGVGQTFNDAALGIKVEVLSKTGSVYRVRVTKTK